MNVTTSPHAASKKRSHEAAMGDVKKAPSPLTSSPSPVETKKTPATDPCTKKIKIDAFIESLPDDYKAQMNIDMDSLTAADLDQWMDVVEQHESLAGVHKSFEEYTEEMDASCDGLEHDLRVNLYPEKQALVDINFISTSVSLHGVELLKDLADSAPSPPSLDSSDDEASITVSGDELCEPVSKDES